jgi:hypothetical protein
MSGYSKAASIGLPPVQMPPAYCAGLDLDIGA